MTDLDPLATRSLERIRGESEAIRRLVKLITRAARSRSTVLVVGESGTGKELVARALHDTSDRNRAPFVTVDCGALADGVVASELFGHERGAFTGAERRREGALVTAKGGTLFLDEVGELPNEIQTHLLGALERRRVKRVGGHEEIAVDVRVVAATHRDLEKAVREGTFRLDLYYRLAVIELRVPPLRERRDDIEQLCDHFLTELGAAEPARAHFGEATLQRLTSHDWPGNVRELRNFVEASLTLGVDDLPLRSSDAPPVLDSFDQLLGLSYRDARTRILREFERRFIGTFLQRSGGNVAQAARAMRMDRSYLFELLRQHPDLRRE